MVWQLIMLAVVTLTVLEIALVQTTKHDDIMVASRTASHRKKLNNHADATKLVKPSRRIARQLRPGI